LVGDAKARKEEHSTERFVHAALHGGLTFRNYTHFEPRFRALLLTGEASEVELALV
jgi:hypothetical protein